MVVVITNALRDGWEAYREAVLDEYTVKALRLTLLAAVVAVTVNTIFGLFASFLLSKFYFRGRRVLAALIDIPFSISPVIAGLVFILTFGNIGWMGDFLKAHDIRSCLPCRAWCLPRYLSHFRLYSVSCFLS